MQGSISNAGDAEVVSMAFVATVVAGCAGGVVALVAHRFATRYWKMGPTINGALAGMVSVCCGCDALYPWAAFTAGAIGSAVYLALSRLVLRIGVDDPIDAFAVHAGAGEEWRRRAFNNSTNPTNTAMRSIRYVMKAVRHSHNG